MRKKIDAKDEKIQPDVEKSVAGMEEVLGGFDVDGDDSGFETAGDEKTEQESKWKKEKGISRHWRIIMREKEGRMYKLNKRDERPIEGAHD